MNRLLSFISLVALSACGRLETITYTPRQTPETWLQIQPYTELKLGGQSIVFVQPSTSIVVYALGFLTIAAGLYFLKIRQGQRSRLWWGIALLLWGMGALLAGTSYEAFSYSIKCAGRTACLWTSWWEILYLIVSAWSIDAMILAVAYSSATAGLRTGLSGYAIFNAVIYFIVVLIGAWIPVRFLISFEFLLLVAAPGIVILFAISIARYTKQRQQVDLIYLGTWLLLGIVILAYFAYFMSGIPASLWENGIWFSENDVLHIGLILWMSYIAFVLARRVKDLTVTV